MCENHEAKSLAKNGKKAVCRVWSMRVVGALGIIEEFSEYRKTGTRSDLRP